MVNLRRIFKLSNTILAIGLLPNLLLADTQSYTSYGTIGLIDMPTAASDSDGRLVLSQSGFDGDRRTSLTAQILPRISASFRYSAHGRNGNEAGGYSNYDRSFDLRFRAVDEGQYMPALAIGLNDFIGTGWYTSEYVVGTKNIGPVEVTTVWASGGWPLLAGSTRRWGKLTKGLKPALDEILEWAESWKQPNGFKVTRPLLGVWLGIWAKGSQQNLNIHLTDIIEKRPILNIKRRGITG